MAARFTREQKKAIRELLQMAAGIGADFRPDKACLPIAEARRALNLPLVPYSEFLSRRCWLAGGCVLRWLCGEANNQGTSGGDFDFFFPSLEAVNATARALQARGNQFRGYLAFPQTVREYLKEGVREDRGSGLWDEAGRLVPVSRELVERLRLCALEFRSPLGDKIQLITSLRPTPLDTIARFDLSICQFAVDADSLSFGSAAWSDLLRNRYRHTDMAWPDNTLRRMFKYARRGFWPYPGTALSVTSAGLAWFAVKSVRYALRLALQSFHRGERE